MYPVLLYLSFRNNLLSFFCLSSFENVFCTSSKSSKPFLSIKENICVELNQATIVRLVNILLMSKLQYLLKWKSVASRDGLYFHKSD